jgi:hypothetical protein
MKINKGIFRVWIVYVIVGASIFAYFSWENHWHRVFQDRYYAYVPEGSFREICHPCEDVKYLENGSGLLVDFGTDLLQVLKIKRYGGEPEEIGNFNSKSHVYAAIAMHSDEPLVKGKYIPITIQIMEEGKNKLLSGQSTSYEEKLKNWRNAAKEMRAESDNILGNLAHDFIYLLAIFLIPVMLYATYLWVKKGFDSKASS